MTVATKWEGTPNFWVGREGHPVTAIVDHITAGGISSVIQWFRNPASQVSAHFAIDRAGRIYQFVHVKDSAWANGIVDHPDMSLAWLADAIKRGINPNRLTASIEHEGQSGQLLTEPQYASSLSLHRYLCTGFAIPRTRDHIIGHYQIDSVNRAGCPGKGFPFSRLLADLQK